MSGARRRVLIVDDHATVRRGLRSLIDSEDRYDIVGEAADGRSALDLAEETRPDIVILDYSLPCLNGLGVADQLRRAMPGVEVLVYTQHDDREFMCQLLWAGIRAYVSKADSGADVLAALDALSDGRPWFSAVMTELLLEQHLASPARESAGQLTNRERVVAQQIAEGRLNKQVAHSLGVSIKTVETHRDNIRQKLQLKTTADLVRYAIRNNIVMA